ncbi:MAG TPA: hypothetical protein VHE83_06350 [Mycobacteriales bacterium]|nr:hypothetical protein [Mycobacteriales bacterium]
MHSDFSWTSMLWLAVLMAVLFGVPALTFWWDGRKARRSGTDGTDSGP